MKLYSERDTFEPFPIKWGNWSCASRSGRSFLLGFLGFMGLAATLFLIYSPALHGEFFFDDSPYLIENPQFQVPGVLRQIWLTLNFPDYWPVSYSLFLAEIKLFGTTDPFYYHVVNVVLHLLNCLLFWRILVSVGWSGAYGAAWLFAVHPLATESVAWIFQERTTLSAFFALLSIGCALAYERRIEAPAGLEEKAARSLNESLGAEAGIVPRWPPRLLYALALLTFVASLLAKPATAPLPIFLLITGLFWGRQPWRSYAVRLAPFLAAALAMIALTYIKQNEGRIPGATDFSLWGKIARSWSAYIFYVGKALMPSSLRLLYPRLVWTEIGVISSMGAGLLIVTLLGRRIRRDGPRAQGARLLLWGILGSIVLVSPALNVVRGAYQDLADVADRYAYLLLPVASMMMVAFFSWIGVAWPRFHIRPWGILLLGLFWSHGAWTHAQHFQTAKGAWNFVLEYRPDVALAWYSRGRLKVKEGDYEGATQDLQKALELNPNYHQALLTLAIVKAMHGQMAEAMPLFLRSFELAPQSLDVRQNLRSAWMQWVSVARERGGVDGGITAAQQGVDWALKMGFDSLAMEMQAMLGAMRNHE